jgi:hypothetical protein
MTDTDQQFGDSGLREYIPPRPPDQPPNPADRALMVYRASRTSGRRCARCRVQLTYLHGEDNCNAAIANGHGPWWPKPGVELEDVVPPWATDRKDELPTIDGVDIIRARCAALRLDDIDHAWAESVRKLAAVGLRMLQKEGEHDA